MTAPGDWVWLARIRRPQGRKGEVFADLLTDFPEKFEERRRLWLVGTEEVGRAPAAGSPTPMTVGAPGLDSETWDSQSSSSPPHQVELANHWLHKGGIVLHFAGVDSISAADALKGLAVAIPREERAALGQDETYVADLIGCIVVDVAGAAAADVGMIEDVDRNSGPTPLLVVRGAKGEILIPFARAHLRRVDLDAKRVEMALPEGLVDLNASE